MSTPKENTKLKEKLAGKNFILDVAYALFLKKGYSSVSIKDIMEATALSKGGIYHHFSSKEEILFGVLDQYFFEVLHMDASLLEGLTFRDQVQQVYLRAVQIFAMVEATGPEGIKYPIRRLFHFQLECEAFPEIRRRFRATSLAYRLLVQNLVEEAIGKGEVKPHFLPEVLSFQIVGMIEGVAIHHSTVKNDIDILLRQRYMEMFDPYLDMICPKI